MLGDVQMVMEIVFVCPVQGGVDTGLDDGTWSVAFVPKGNFFAVAK